MNTSSTRNIRILGRDTKGAALLACVTLLAVAGCSPDYPKCDTDEDCHEGEFCVNNLCQQCRGDQDCPAGQRCASGACQAVPGYCTSASDCGEGQDCQNNTCVTRTESNVAPPPPDPVAGQCTLDAVYFDFDSANLEQSARDALSNAASCIKQRGIKSVHMTGLTDPRGTEEYNLALGDRRAQSAKKFLESLAVDAQLSHSSMGEELATGSDEGSWSRDRRVDLQEK
jgi:peptidoglycan-associated lipoprotein